MSDIITSTSDCEGDRDNINEDRNTKKDKLLEGRVVGSSTSPMTLESCTDEEFDFEDGDISRSTVNGILAIDFSKRIQKLLVKDMDSTVVVKLLGCNIGYGVHLNQISSLWKHSQPFQLMDVENGYYLVRFQNKTDYKMVLTQGPWLVFDHCLTVQPWSMDFNPLKPFPSMVLAWIHFLGLPGFLYKWRVFGEIKNLVGKVTKLDIEIDNGARGRFARMAVFVDLEKPLTSQILVNRKVQKVEFEALPAVCFTYGRYGHLKGLRLSTLIDRNIDVDKGRVSDSLAKEFNSTAMGDSFGPWVIVERKYRRYQVGIQSHKAKIMATRLEGSRFEALNSLDIISVEKGEGESAALGAKFQQRPFIKNLKGKRKWPRIGPSDREMKDSKNMGQTPVMRTNELRGNFSFEKDGLGTGNVGEGLDKSVGHAGVVSGLEQLEIQHSLDAPSQKHAGQAWGRSTKREPADGALSCENPIDNAKKVVSGGKRAKCRLGNIINISIKSRGGHFKIAGSSRFPLPKAMNSMTKILSTQMELVKENTDVLNVSADSPNAS
ncbi:hypothetical protein Goshw_022452 [Gossypium schwendimanii]|uniref:DUF4283 domain-containing protein n=1 Tax=Gossypium schwendimanii TaxID=34291 RepID=A0A7J9LQ42_GOSSC|nr:hypothetical protein [Gossypium schwendimanii]